MAAPKGIQNVALGVAIVVELVVLVGHPLFGWGPRPHHVAATPPPLTIRTAPEPTARQVLLDLADVARAAAARTPGTHGRWAHVMVQTWQLADQRVPGRRPRRPLTRVVSTWRSRDAPGRAVTVLSTRDGVRTTTRALPAGLPASGRGRGASTAQALTRFADLAAAEPVAPATEARILSALAGDAGLVDAGVARDRDGVTGPAISFTGPEGDVQVRDTLVLSPRTGALLEFEQTLAGDPHGLNVGSGAVLADTLYEGSAWVDRLGATSATPAPR